MSAAPHEAIVGDWDGTRTRARLAASEQLADLQRHIRAAYLDVVDHRDRASTDPSAEGRVRAVAYQTCASRLLRVLDTQRPTGMKHPTECYVAGQVCAHPASEPCDPYSVAARTKVPTGAAAAPAPVDEKRPLGWLFNRGVRADG